MTAEIKSEDFLREKISPHIKRLIEEGNNAIELQFKSLSKKLKKSSFKFDPLAEDTLYSPARGLTHKFSNRLLWKINLNCASYCQFCTRRRQIGLENKILSRKDIKKGINYLYQHKEIEDVIISGGDPFCTPKATEFLIKEIDKINSVKVIRIGTRLPIHSPELLARKEILSLMKIISKISTKKPIFVLLHVEHPSELTHMAKNFIQSIKKTGAIVLSQTVFLKKINDNVDVLASLFTGLYHLGVIPYYIYRCDYVRGLEKFICPIRKEMLIMTKLRKTLSGIAIPTYVIDVEGRGKIPVPLNFWRGTNLSECNDFDGKKIQI